LKRERKIMTSVAVIHAAFEDTPRTVAFVEVGDRTGNEALEYAFRRTNNVMGSWSRGETLEWDGETVVNEDFSNDVTVMAELPVSKRTGEVMGLRSTSMGDFMLLGNTKYEVAMCGFKEVA
jgi:hypothetical protein